MKVELVWNQQVGSERTLSELSKLTEYPYFTPTPGLGQFVVVLLSTISSICQFLGLRLFFLMYQYCPSLCLGESPLSLPGHEDADGARFWLCFRIQSVLSLDW